MKKTKNPQVARSLILASIIGSAAITPATVFASVYTVTDAGDTMTPGTLRHALEVAQASDIHIANSVGDIMINSTLTYSKRKALSIHGTGQTIETSNDVDILALTQGASLTAKNLDFQGPGGFDVNNQAMGSLGKGIFIDVRDDQKGTVHMYLKNVSVLGVANHGIHISDCTLADDCGSGSGGGGDGSNASINIQFHNVTIDNAGNGKFDADGLRVDERGKGSITFNSYGSTFKNVGADGVELDEGDNGGVYAFTKNNTFDSNGNYCDPTQFKFDDEIEVMGNIEDDEMAITVAKEAHLMSEATMAMPNADFSCVEAEAEYDSDDDKTVIELGLDLDDGIDLDEAGNGSIEMKMVKSTVSNNLDEGVDLDEEGKGGMWLEFINSKVFDNRDDGVKLTEEDEGGLTAKVVKSSATGNDKGFVFEELGKGSVWFDIIMTESVANDGDGIEIEEADNGSLEGNVIKTTSSMSDDGKGFDIQESGNGNLNINFKKTTAIDNDNDDLEADQEDAGIGEIKIRNSNIGARDIDGIVVDEV